MVEINVEHDHGRKATYLLPESFNDLSPKQFLQVVQILALPRDAFFKYCAALYVFSNHKKKKFRKIPVQEIAQLTEHLQWLSKADELLLEESKLPYWRLSKGPGQYMLDLTLRQMEDADACISALVEDQEPDLDNLVLLFAVLYRPFWLPYSRWSAETWWAWWVKKRVKRVVLEAALLNYIGLRKALAALFPLTFSSGDSEGQLKVFGVDVLIDSIAGDKLGDIDKVGSRKIREIFIHVESALINAEASKEKTRQ